MRKNEKIFICILIIITVIVTIKVIKRGKKNNISEEGIGNPVISTEQNGNSNESEGQKINLEEKSFKKSIEKTIEGIKITDAKITSNANNIITVSLNAKNENNEERIVTIAVTYYNEAGEKIGENGFAIGNLNVNESKSIDSTCYISELNVKETKIEVIANKIEVNDNKNDSEAGADTDTSTSTTQSN